MIARTTPRQTRKRGLRLTNMNTEPQCTPVEYADWPLCDPLWHPFRTVRRRGGRPHSVGSDHGRCRPPATTSVTAFLCRRLFVKVVEFPDLSRANSIRPVSTGNQVAEHVHLPQISALTLNRPAGPNL